MGWNTGFALLDEATPDDVVDAVNIFGLTDEWIGMDDTFDSLAVGTVGGWTVFWNRGQLVPPAGRTRSAVMREVVSHLASAGGRMLLLSFSRSTSTYAFEWYVNGRRVRRAAFVNGKIADQRGKPLPEEADIPTASWGVDEDFLLELTRRLTGVGVEALSEGEYEVLGD